MPNVRMKLTSVEFLDDGIPICIFEPSDFEPSDENEELRLAQDEPDDLETISG